jgi:class 3 adenylate cyclase
MAVVAAMSSAKENPPAKSSMPALPQTATIDWLLRSAAGVASPAVMLGEMCDRLSGEGVPIAGALLSVASLDPLVARSRMRWSRSATRVAEEIQFHGMAAVAEGPANPAGIKFTLAGEHQIEWTAQGEGGFEAPTRAYLEALALAMGAPLQAVVERGIARSLLQAYLGRRSAERVLSGTIRRGTGEVIDAVVWVSDLRDFTQLSEKLDSVQVIAALNDCCARLVGAIQPFGGEVLKFIGDGLLAIFPVAPRGESAACAAALAAVRAAREGMVRLDRERIGADLPPLPFGVGLHLGPVVYGNIGAPDRLDFTAIGTAVNVASRIEGLCRTLAYPVLISEAVAARSAGSLTPVGSYPIRGSATPVALFTLPELAKPNSGSS